MQICSNKNYCGRCGNRICEAQISEVSLYSQMHASSTASTIKDKVNTNDCVVAVRSTTASAVVGTVCEVQGEIRGAYHMGANFCGILSL